MNKGIRMAKGEVIGFINSDDFYSSPFVLETVADVFKDASVDACYGDLCYVEKDDIASVVRYWRSSVFSPGLFLRGWCPPHPTFFVRRSIYQRLSSFDLQYKIAADVELMARFMEVHRIRTRYIPEVLVTMRLGGTTNRSWSNVVRQNREIFRALKAHGLRPSLASFGFGKLFSRSKQFLTRPK
jgi:glycosyltransferase involved in cell wall biosynthesis